MARGIKCVSFPVSFDKQVFSGINLVAVIPVSLARDETCACLKIIFQLEDEIIFISMDIFG